MQTFSARRPLHLAIIPRQSKVRQSYHVVSLCLVKHQRAVSSSLWPQPPSVFALTQAGYSMMREHLEEAWKACELNTEFPGVRACITNQGILDAEKDRATDRARSRH
jgi:hypothetical protein